MILISARRWASPTSLTPSRAGSAARSRTGIRVRRYISLAAATTLSFGAQAHPLDGLTGPEIARAVEVLRAERKLTDGKVATVTLEEPAKADVLGWAPGSRLPRLAHAQI